MIDIVSLVSADPMAVHEHPQASSGIVADDV
jgi:hypothetical protein